MPNKIKLFRDRAYSFDNCQALATRLKKNYPIFQDNYFLINIKKNFPTLQLKERSSLIEQLLQELLPKNFNQLVKIILNSQLEPLPIDSKIMQYGNFIAVPQANLIARESYKNFSLAMVAMYSITKRFSCEFALRKLIDYDYLAVFKYLQIWVKDDNPHIRRLCSEGIRPLLPWASRITLFQEKPEIVISILNQLYNDTSRYVVRSVANCLNDINKNNPQIVIATLDRWQYNIRNQKEFNWLKKHSLRTLIKLGHKQAFLSLGFSQKIEIISITLHIKNKIITLPKNLEFNCIFSLKKANKLIIDYIIGFQKLNAKISHKVFKLKNLFAHTQAISVTKKHLFREMTTRKLYSGKHTLTIQINGKKVIQQNFIVKLN